MLKLKQKLNTINKFIIEYFKTLLQKLYNIIEKNLIITKSSKICWEQILLLYWRLKQDSNL